MTKSTKVPNYTYDQDTGKFFNRWGKEVGSYTRKYGRTCYKGNHINLSRLAFYYVEGWWPEEVDHIDGNPHNNKWDNLRAADRSENQRNKKTYKTNKLGYKGVYPQYYKSKKYYSCSIQVDKKRIFLGRYETPELAALAYNEAALKYHGEFARLNKIKEN